jgi:hypothetical protein
MSASGFYKRFPVARRRACVPVTSARPAEAEKSQQVRAAAQQSGAGISREESIDAGRSEIKRIKGVVEK